MVKNIGTVLLILLLAAGGYAIYSEIRGQRADLAALKAADEKAQAAIAEKEKANVALLNENVKLRAQDAASEAVTKRLRADLAAKTIENDKLRNDLKTAPPETVLAQTQGWLAIREIWLRSNAASQTEAVFSLAAFRLNADALAEWQSLKFTLAPSLELQLREADVQNATKSILIANLKTIVQNATFIIGEKEDQILVRDDTIVALKHRNFWRALGLVAGSFALGFIIGK
jgi:hypothetical protein